MSTEVRPYETRFQPGIEWLYARTPPAGSTYVRPQRISKDLLAIEEHFLCCLVAIEDTREGEAVVGLICIAALDRDDAFTEPDFVPRDGAVRVRHMLVVPERQRRGIGRQLLEAASHWAHDAGHGTIVLETTTEQEAALDFYRAQRFGEIGRSMIGRWELVWFSRASG